MSPTTTLNAQMQALSLGTERPNSGHEVQKGHTLIMQLALSASPQAPARSFRETAQHERRWVGTIQSLALPTIHLSLDTV